MAMQGSGKARPSGQQQILRPVHVAQHAVVGPGDQVRFDAAQQLAGAGVAGEGPQVGAPVGAEADRVAALGGVGGGGDRAGVVEGGGDGGDGCDR